MSQDKITLKVNVLGTTWDVDVDSKVTVKDLIADTEREFSTELQQDEIVPPYYLWVDGEDDTLSPGDTFGHRPNAQLMFGNQPPKAKPLPLTTADFERLRSVDMQNVPLVYEGKRHPVKRCPIIIGRMADKTKYVNREWFQLDLNKHKDGNDISRTHCAIIYHAERYYCYAIGEKTIVFVDGEQVEPNFALPLKSGSVIQLGNLQPPVRLTFESPNK